MSVEWCVIYVCMGFVFNSLCEWLNVAKCNLGKVNLEAMLSSNRWRQEARLQPWRLAGALCDAYTQLAARGGPRALAGALRDLSRSVLFAIIRKLISLAQLLASFAIFAQPTLPRVGHRASW